MGIWLWVATIVFIVVSAIMVLVILVQRPQGGGLAGAFGGAGGAGTETVFGGRVGDALTYATVTAFVIWLGLAIALNLLDTSRPAGPLPTAAAATTPIDGQQPTPTGMPAAPAPGTGAPAAPAPAPGGGQ